MALQDALVSLARLHWRLPIAPARQRRRRSCRPQSTAPSACSLDANARLEDARVGEDCSVTRPHACAVMHSRPQPREVLATEKGSQTRASSRRGLRQRRPEHAQDAVHVTCEGGIDVAGQPPVEPGQAQCGVLHGHCSALFLLQRSCDKK